MSQNRQQCGTASLCRHPAHLRRGGLSRSGIDQTRKHLTPWEQGRAALGLPAKSVITNDDILCERRVEFALKVIIGTIFSVRAMCQSKSHHREAGPGHQELFSFSVTNFTEAKMFLPHSWRGEIPSWAKTLFHTTSEWVTGG